jgi:hypothetical protein
MSIVTVHGPNTMFTDAPGVINSSPAGAKATQDATNGLKFSFALTADSPQGGSRLLVGLPSRWHAHAAGRGSAHGGHVRHTGNQDSNVDRHQRCSHHQQQGPHRNVATLTSNAHGFLVGQTVVVAGVDAVFNGTYVITAVTANTFSYAKVNADVTSAAATGTATPSGLTPAAGSYTITVNAVTGRPKGTGDDGGGGQQQQQLAPAPNVEVAAGDVDVAYDPGAHNISEVLDFARENRDQIPDLITTERAGKNRSTLISQLEELRA